MSPDDRSDLQTYAEQVRRHDHDRYLTALFAPAAVLAGRSEPPLRAAVSRLAEVASRHLDQARAASLPRASLPVLLSARLAARSLQLLERADHDPFTASVQTPQTGKAWRLLLSAISGRL